MIMMTMAKWHAKEVFGKNEKDSHWMERREREILTRHQSRL